MGGKYINNATSYITFWAMFGMIILSKLFIQPDTDGIMEGYIQSLVTEVIKERCHCDFQENFISQAEILCDLLEPTQFVYRASITRYANYSADQLVGYIEDWVRTGPSVSIDLSVVVFDSNCPVRISTLSDPICELPSATPVSTVLPPSSNTPAAITVGVTVAVITMATITAVGVTVLVCFLKKKKKW